MGRQKRIAPAPAATGQGTSNKRARVEGNTDTVRITRGRPRSQTIESRAMGAKQRVNAPRVEVPAEIEDVVIPTPSEDPPNTSSVYVNSTNMSHQQSHQESVGRSSSNAEELIEVFKETLRTVREAAMSESDSRVSSRVASSRELPEFSGDPLQFVSFKRALHTSTALAGYSDAENIQRLRKALKGDAQKEVETLLLTTEDVDEVMEALEFRYGSKDLVAGSILKQIYELPAINSAHISMVQFASRLSSAVKALKGSGLQEHLYSPDLFRTVINKLPKALTFTYYRCIASLPTGLTNLEKITEFVKQEAKYAIEGGALSLELATPQSALKKPPAPKRVEKTYATTAEHETVAHATEESEVRCQHCQRAGHALNECRKFNKEPYERKWLFVRKVGACYKCLNTGHRRFQCKSTNVCAVCSREHHTALHGQRSNENANNKRNAERRDEDIARGEVTASAKKD